MSADHASLDAAALTSDNALVPHAVSSAEAPAPDDLTAFVDVALLQSMMDDFYDLTNIPMSLLDTSGTVVVGAGWQDVCIRFHRANPATCANCTESDTVLTSDIPPGEARLYKCKNGMWDAATPVTVDGQRLGTVFTGQFFFDDESIDVDFFARQARRHGFDEQEYLSAVDAAPRLSHADVDVGLRFLTRLATMIAQFAVSAAETERVGKRLSEALITESAAAAEMARLYEAQRAAAKYSEALNTINRAVNSTRTIDGILHEVVLNARDVLGAETAAVFELDGDDIVGIAAAGFDGPIEGLRMPATRSPHGLLALTTKQSVAIDDALDDSRVERELMVEYGIKSVLVIPLLVRDAAVGVLYFNYHSRATHFSTEKIDFANKLAAALALALENARLLEDERLHAAMGEALADVSAILSSTFDVDDVMPSVLERIVDTAGASGMSVAMRDAETWSVTHGIGVQEGLGGTRWDPAAVPSQEDALTSQLPVIVQDVLESPRVNRSIAKDLGYRSFGVYPLIVRAQAIGTVSITFSEPHRLDADIMTFMSRAEYIISTAIESARLYEAEHHIAETLQETLVVLPSHLKEIAFSRAYESATSETGRVGGDFVDLFEVRGHTIGIVIGDVSGKGMDAAVITALVRNTIRAHALDGRPPSVVVEKTNRVMWRFTDSEAYVTLFFGLLDTRTGLLRYVSAGHPPALVVSDGAPSQELRGGSSIVGAFEGAQFRESRYMLRRNERLVLYTDGVIEARSPDGREFFDIAGLKHALHRHRRLKTEKLADAVIADVTKFSKGILRDDSAVLVVEPTQVAQPDGSHPRLDLGDEQP